MADYSVVYYDDDQGTSGIEVVQAGDHFEASRKVAKKLHKKDQKDGSEHHIVLVIEGKHKALHVGDDNNMMASAEDLAEG